MFNILKIIRRLFEPALNTKTKTFKMIFEGFWSYLWWNLLPIISIPILINYINAYDYEKIKSFSILIIFVYIVMWIVHIFIMKWEIGGKYASETYLIDKYVLKTILKDNISMEKFGTGKVQSIVKNGIDAWVNVNYEILYYSVRSILGIITGIYIILNFDIRYVPYFIFILATSFFAYSFFKKIKLKYDSKVNDIGNNLNKDYVRIIMSRQEIILNVNEQKEIKNLISSVKKQLSESVVGAKYNFLSDLAVSGLIMLLPFVGVSLFINSVELNPVNVAFLISFIYFSTRFMETMYNMTWSIGQVFESYPKIKALWDFVDNTPELKGYKEGVKFKHKNGDIELRNVSLTYGQNEILKDFNLKIEPKQKVAFVGRSGSGKTTIVKLISGFMRPTSGEIFVDGQELKKVSLSTYYKNIGYLTQEPMIFDASIRENLLYSFSSKDLRKISDSRLFEVLKLAECEFVKDLDTQIGEKGIRLSGGERQRLAIAKLMLKNPEIIILDEPTSALDSFSEDAITRALDKLFENKTVIIIAHRLQTVRKADKIYVIENGKIVEEGDHHGLKQKEGEYKKMLDLQVGD